jgi:hypothetical protein
MAPAYILQFVRLCLEYGFVGESTAKKLLDLVLKATLSLMKLEESWTEKQMEKKSMFSERMKVFNAVGLFAKCREHISMIVIQILVLLSDQFFIKSITQWTKDDAAEHTITEETKENIPFLDKSLNDSVLTITMNYLSKTTEILFSTFFGDIRLFPLFSSSIFGFTTLATCRTSNLVMGIVSAVTSKRLVLSLMFGWELRPSKREAWVGLGTEGEKTFLL